ncbi:MAG: DeoR/GlpR family DNA-binding transcription regulator [Sphaerochaetaceae bacterium]
MIPAQRQQQILALIADQKVVQVQQLSKQFNVSVLTIRRDLDLLAKQKLIERTHGGATLRRSLAIEPTYSQKALEYPQQKVAIAHTCASLIEEGDTVFINSGSTTSEVLRALQGMNITIVTNNIDAAWLANEGAQFRLIFVGGQYRTRSHSVSGNLAACVIEQIYANKAIIGIDGFSLTEGLTTPVMEEAETTRSMIRQTAGKVIVAASSNKIGVISNFKTVKASAIDVLVTDSDAQQLLTQQELEEIGIKLIIAHEG